MARAQPLVYLHKPANTKTDPGVSIMSGNGKVIEERLSLSLATPLLLLLLCIKAFKLAAFYSRLKDAIKNSNPHTSWLLKPEKSPCPVYDCTAICIIQMKRGTRDARRRPR